MQYEKATVVMLDEVYSFVDDYLILRRFTFWFR